MNYNLHEQDFPSANQIATSQGLISLKYHATPPFPQENETNQTKGSEKESDWGKERRNAHTHGCRFRPSPLRVGPAVPFSATPYVAPSFRLTLPASSAATSGVGPAYDETRSGVQSANWMREGSE